MNTENYASLEASRRLVEAGIVLETDCFWYLMSGQWVLSTWRHPGSYSERIPAPCMAEVWRELPIQCKLKKYSDSNTVFDPSEEYSFDNENPTDALIDLLIWVRKEKK